MQPSANEPTPPVTPIQTTVPPTTYPGKTLGIAGFILSFITNPLGLILSIVAYVQSKKAGYKNTLALAGIVIGSVFTVLAIVIFALVTPALFSKSSNLIEQCQDLGPGTHVNGSTTITCS